MFDVLVLLCGSFTLRSLCRCMGLLGLYEVIHMRRKGSLPTESNTDIRSFASYVQLDITINLESMDTM